MKALVWDNIKEMNIREVDEPLLKPGWVILEAKEVGICGSEISAYLGHNELRKPPSVMGHEFSGIVRDLGGDAPSGLKDKLVAVNPLVTCGKCRHCKNGNRHLCEERKIIGVNYPGAFASLVTAPAESCYEIVDPTKGSLAEPLATALRAVRRSDAQIGDRFVVIGAGAIGLFATKILRDIGVSDLIVVDTNMKRLEWAKKWGASETINPEEEGYERFLNDIDGVIDAVGYGKTRNTAINIVRRGGHVVFVGLHENESSIPGNVIVRNEVNILGSFCYSDDDFRTAVNLLNNDFIDTRGGWLDIRPLEEGNKSFLEQTYSTAPFSKIVLKVS